MKTRTPKGKNSSGEPGDRFFFDESALVSASGSADAVRAICATLAAGLTPPEIAYARLQQAKKLSMVTLAFVRAAEEVFEKRLKAGEAPVQTQEASPEPGDGEDGEAAPEESPPPEPPRAPRGGRPTFRPRFTV